MIFKPQLDKRKSIKMGGRAKRDRVRMKAGRLDKYKFVNYQDWKSISWNGLSKNTDVSKKLLSPPSPKAGELN